MYSEAADLVCSRRETFTLSEFSTYRCTHRLSLWRGKHTSSSCMIFLSFHTLSARNCTTVQITLMDSQWLQMWKRHSQSGSQTMNESFSCPSSQSILFLCTPHIWGLSNFPRQPPQIRPRHTVFCIFMCVPSYLNPSYYSHGWPCQGEICSLTVNGPILTARPPHQRSV